MPPPRGATKLAPTKLPPLPHLRIKRPNQSEGNPCMGIMTSVLGCWASTGYSVTGCAALEQALRACTDAPKTAGKKKNSINYHLARMYPKIVGPRKGQ